jgi:hypothetical protein
MKSQTLLGLSILSFFLSACVKDVPVLEDGQGSFSGSGSLYLAPYDKTALYDGRMIYLANGQREVMSSGEILESVTYYGEAEFEAFSTHVPEDVGIVSFGAIDIKNDEATNYGRNVYQFSGKNYSDERNEKQFGFRTEFAISGGSSYGPCKTTVSVPKVILLDTVTTPCNCKPPQIAVSSLPYTIRWNQDVSNDKGVVVTIWYEGWGFYNEGTGLDSTFSSYNRIVVPDLGHYALTLSDLKKVPLGGTFRITVSRGNEGVMTTNRKKINVVVYTKSDRYYMLSQ